MATNNALNNNLANCSGLPIPGGVSATGTPSSTTFLRGDGTWAVPAGGSGVTTCNIQVLTASSGTYTPTLGMKFIIVEMCGGGGGSGGVSCTAGNIASSASGSAGSYLKFMMTAAQVGASLAYTVGAAGTAGTSTPTAGGNGGNTTFGTWTAGGGLGSALQNATANNFVQGNLATSNTVGTGQVLLNIRSRSNSSSNTSVSSLFLLSLAQNSTNLMSMPDDTGEFVRMFASTGSTTAGSAQTNYFGGGYGVGGGGSYVYSQASAASNSNNGKAGTAGAIIVTEFI